MDLAEPESCTCPFPILGMGVIPAGVLADPVAAVEVVVVEYLLQKK